MRKRLVYRAIRPKWWVFVIKVIFSGLAFAAVAFMIAAAVCEYIENRDYGTLVSVTAVSLFCYVIFLVMVIKSLVNEKKALGSRGRCLSGLDEYSLEKLEEEAGAAVPYYKCIYLLGEYLFVPKAGLLLRYEEIENYKTIYHSTNGAPDGVYVEVYDNEGVKYRFSVNRWRDYKRDYYEFMGVLADKGVFKGEDAPGGYIPVGKI